MITIHEFQGCIYPWYQKSFGNLGSQDTCEDKSDQWFPLNSTCRTIEDYLEIHWDTFCNTDADVTRQSGLQIILFIYLGY